MGDPIHALQARVMGTTKTTSRHEVKPQVWQHRGDHLSNMPTQNISWGLNVTLKYLWFHVFMVPTIHRKLVSSSLAFQAFQACTCTTWAIDKGLKLGQTHQNGHNVVASPNAS